mgnify:CR=1 FL=1
MELNEILVVVERSLPIFGQFLVPIIDLITNPFDLTQVLNINLVRKLIILLKLLVIMLLYNCDEI